MCEVASWLHFYAGKIGVRRNKCWEPWENLQGNECSRHFQQTTEANLTTALRSLKIERHRKSRRSFVPNQLFFFLLYMLYRASPQWVSTWPILIDLLFLAVVMFSVVSFLSWYQSNIWELWIQMLKNHIHTYLHLHTYTYVCVYMALKHHTGRWPYLASIFWKKDSSNLCLFNNFEFTFLLCCAL